VAMVHVAFYQHVCIRHQGPAAVGLYLNAAHWAACLQVVNALGFYKGAFHVECMYTDKHGAVLLECNPRVGGGPIRYFNNLLNGMSLATTRVIRIECPPCVCWLTAQARRALGHLFIHVVLCEAHARAVPGQASSSSLNSSSRRWTCRPNRSC
jgi:hypothetical protein